jgi:hypothetical protein
MASEKSSKASQKTKSPDRGPGHFVPMALAVLALICAGIVFMFKPESPASKNDKPAGANTSATPTK